MASDDYVLHFIVKEDNKCAKCAKNESPVDSVGRLSKDTQSNNSNKANNCSKCSSQCGSFHLDYSNNFHADDASRRASSSSSSYSEQNNCGSSQNYYYDDFHTDSSETSSRNRSSCRTPLEQLETKKDAPLKKKTENDHQAKGGKTLPKKKRQQKTYLSANSIINSQKSNSVACRLLSARLHKVKELKNEVSVLKRKLEASNMENQILKRLQYRHLKAISKYENAETNLPDLLAKQCNEVKTLRTHLRRSREQERNASRKLREVEAQLLKTKDTLQALQKLSEDKNLAERGELKHRLTTLTQRMEASDKRIQGLEKQLLLNNTSFSHQLAAEKKKTLEAQSITTGLQMEIKLLNQKIKEKERELGIRNIYANRMLKGQQEKADSKSPLKDINVSKLVQVDINLEAMTPQHQETNRSAVVITEELTTKDINEKSKLHDGHKEMGIKRKVHQSEKLPIQEISDKTCTELIREEICPSTEKYFRCENLERQKNRRERQGLDLLKEEFDKLRAEQSLQTINDIEKKENKLEEAITKTQENKEGKGSAEAREEVCDKLPKAIQRHRTPSKLKKQYVFTEAIENLHQGFPSTRRLSTLTTTCKSREVNTHQSGTAEFKAGDSDSAYEPSFCKITKARHKDTTSTCDENCIPTVSVEKKNTLMEELFGPNCLLKDNNPNLNLKEVGKEKDILQNEKTYDEISFMNDSLQCGDSKQVHMKAFHAVAFLENLK
uniref:Lebercilin-like protein n=1 Tax=Pogona vitticeps TaxID=103695 RepID=A0A6J0TFS7_9SAUR